MHLCVAIIHQQYGIYVCDDCLTDPSDVILSESAAAAEPRHQPSQRYMEFTSNQTANCRRQRSTSYLSCHGHVMSWSAGI